MRIENAQGLIEMNIERATNCFHKQKALLRKLFYTVSIAACYLCGANYFVSKKHDAMIRLSIFIVLMAALLTSCGGAAVSTTTTDSLQTSTESAADDVEMGLISKNISAHFETFKKNVLSKTPGDVVIIKKDETNGYIEFRHDWKDADGGTVYRMAVWKGDNINDVLAVFKTECSGGGCDFKLDDFAIYDVNFNLLTADHIDLPTLTKQYQDAIPEKEKMGFKGYKGFFVTIPQKGTRLEFCLVNPEEEANSAEPGTKTIFAEYDYDKKVGRFVEVASQYQEGAN